MTRKCDCAGGACGPQEDEVTRREFVTLLGVGTAAAGTLLGSAPSLAAASGQAATADSAAAALTRWKRDIHAPAKPRVYDSATHGDARMPLGGIGTGNFDIGADGQFTTWQLFNTLRDGYVPLFFGIRAGGTARLLQTAGGPPDLPRIPRIEMTGEYPLATLRFHDPALPVQAEMTAFTPFAPQDTRLSSMPLAAFVFRLHNPGKQKQTVSLGAFMQNPVGYDASGPPRSFNSFGFNPVGQRWAAEHPNFGGNVNRVERRGGATTLEMRAEAGGEPTLDRRMAIYTNANPDGLNLLPVDHPKELTVANLDALTKTAAVPTDPKQAVIWLEDAPADLSEPVLRAARDAVRAGATLVFSGKSHPLLQAAAQATGAAGKPLDQTAPDLVFMDFESGYDGWTVEGEAFGKQPAAGTLPNQQQVSGFRGRGLVNSFLGGDDATGRLVSRSFRIERNYIRFLIGGGSHAKTQIRLLIGDKVVQATAGKNEERLLPALWDVRTLRGQTARIEIVDDQKGPWGHINVDHIEFSDLPFSRAVLEVLNELRPASFTGVQPLAGETATPNAARFDNLKLRDKATETATRSGLKLINGNFGEGRVILAAGPLLDTAQAPLIGARQKAFALVAEIVGANYTAPQSIPATAPGFGTLALGTLSAGATALPAFDSWKAAWDTFAATGKFATPAGAKPNAPTPTGQTINGALAASVEVPAGKTVEVVYFLTWHYPNKYTDVAAGKPPERMGNHYTTLWPDAQAVAREAATIFPTLREKTERFQAAFYDSTLPYWMLDCVSSQISTIRHVGVVFRIANGDIYGWEGSNGCCPPTCTHVWGYEQTLARLFPDLEKDMRRIDFMHQQLPSGGVNNRTEVPSPPRPTGERPFSDGHASTVLKAYREALNHPDDTWMKTYWPRVQKAVEYLIARDAATTEGGAGPDGTLSDDQWNTYDNAIHGVNSFIGTYYLAALRAGEEMARRMGDSASAERYHAVFEKGRENLVRLCWNGEYFQQHLPGYEQRAGEYGPGCLSDQVIGQWWAHQLGLGYLLPREHIQSALRAVFKHNWLPDHSNWRHNWRKFAGGKDKGLLICTWPKGGRPADTIPYVDEVWTGIEYQVAAHMMYEGMMEEALAIVKGARERYDGVPRPPMPRSPWNEIECGGHYARAMSSWSLLTALSGFEYDGPAKTLRFTPRTTPTNFKAFFSGPEGWGSLRQTRRGKTQRNEVVVREGQFAVTRLHLDNPAGSSVTPERVRVTLGSKVLPATLATEKKGGVTVMLNTPVLIKQGETFTVAL